MTATDPTFSPAVERAAELLIREAETTGLIRDDVRNGLAAALDVEEMALVLHDNPRALEPETCNHCEDMLRLATKLRAAILGPES